MGGYVEGLTRQEMGNGSRLCPDAGLEVLYRPATLVVWEFRQKNSGNRELG
jgi:hypothetical protein